MEFIGLVIGLAFISGIAGLVGVVISALVSGTLVVGRYSHPFGSFDTTLEERYFSFDTRNGTIDEYPNEAALVKKLGHPIHLVPTQFFESEEPSYKRQQSINKSIFRAPPLLVVTIYILCLVRFRRARTKPETVV